MGVLCHIPCVVENAGVFTGVRLVLLGDAHALREEAGIVGTVESAREEAALLYNVGDVAHTASVAGVDVDNFRGGGSGASGWRWKTLVCFVRECGGGDVVEVKKVILL